MVETTEGNGLGCVYLPTVVRSRLVCVVVLPRLIGGSGGVLYFDSTQRDRNEPREGWVVGIVGSSTTVL